MKCILIVGMVVLLGFAGIANVVEAEAAQRVRGDLSVEVSPEGNRLNVVYTIENLTAWIIAPSQKDEYRYTIRNVQTGVEVAHGNLDSAFDADVSQYAMPYGHAVFAVKQIPITDEMRDDSGFYLMFLTNTFVNCNGEETVFYIPENLGGGINAQLNSIHEIVSETRSHFEYQFSQVRYRLRKIQRYVKSIEQLCKKLLRR